MEILTQPTRLNSLLRRWTGSDYASLVFLRGKTSAADQASLSLNLISNLEKWKALLPESHLRDRFFSEPSQPNKEWFLSRQALIESLVFLTGSLGVHQHERKDSDRIWCSLSHTKNPEPTAVSFAISHSAVIGAGVDLEHEARRVSESVFRRIHRVEEMYFETNPLIHWLLKEASWKAHPRAEETVISHYEITAKKTPTPEFTEYRLKCRSIPCEFKAILVREGEFWIALSVATSD